MNFKGLPRSSDYSTESYRTKNSSTSDSRELSHLLSEQITGRTLMWGWVESANRLGTWTHTHRSTSRGRNTRHFDTLQQIARLSSPDSKVRQRLLIIDLVPAYTTPRPVRKSYVEGEIPGNFHKDWGRHAMNRGAGRKFIDRFQFGGSRYLIFPIDARTLQSTKAASLRTLSVCALLTSSADANGEFRSKNDSTASCNLILSGFLWPFVYLPGCLYKFSARMHFIQMGLMDQCWQGQDGY